MGEMIPVVSSNIRAIGFEVEEEPVDPDQAWGTLAIEFANGTTYHYAQVEEETFNELRNAPSVGAYFHQAIRNVYEATKVET